jgi:phage regulator Rha-like protein
MTENSIEKYSKHIINRIFTVRKKQVMLDSHLAELYGIETKYLNRAVKRNPVRFPESFMFQLTKEEFENLRFQIGTSKDALIFHTDPITNKGGRRYQPYVFTEQGVAMLSAVLNSETAVKTSIMIMNAFVEMRHFLIENASLFERIQRMEIQQTETESKVQLLFDAMEKNQLRPQQGIFFNGQVFDAWVFISDLIKKANNNLILIDNYVDDTVLSLFTKKRRGVSVVIYTKNITQALLEDVKKFNTQYDALTIQPFKAAHDRFLIIDKTEVYHIGASLKDLGKKWFAFSKMEMGSLILFEKLGL